MALEVARRMDLRYLDREILDSVAQLEAIEACAGRIPCVLHLLGARPRLPAVASASLREQAKYEARIGELITQHGLDRDAAVAQLQSEGVQPYEPSQGDLSQTIVAQHVLHSSAIQDEIAGDDKVVIRRTFAVFIRRRQE